MLIQRFTETTESLLGHKTEHWIDLKRYPPLDGTASNQWVCVTDDATTQGEFTDIQEAWAFCVGWCVAIAQKVGGDK